VILSTHISPNALRDYIYMYHIKNSRQIVEIKVANEISSFVIKALFTINIIRNFTSVEGILLYGLRSNL